jgi:hypothetical protein
MSTRHDAAIDVQQDGSQVTITLRTASQPQDALIPVTADALKPLGLEYGPIVRHAQTGTLRTCWIGRNRFTKLSWLLALVEALPPATTDAPEDDLTEAARKRARRRSP